MRKGRAKWIVVLYGIFFSGCALTAVAFFNISSEVVKLRKEADRLNGAIAYDREVIHILRAEWAYLSSPQRIENAAQLYLGMRDEDIKQSNQRRPCLGNNVLVFNTKDNKAPAKLK